MTGDPTPGGTVSADDVRQGLQTALADLRPSTLSLEAIRQRAARRRRHRRWASAGFGAALAGAAAVAAVLVMGDHHAGDRAVVQPAVTPSVDPAQSLHDYVRANGGTQATGPLTDPDGTFAVDVVGERVHVLAFDGTGWTSVTDLGSPLGRVPPVDTARGPEGAGDGVTFQIDLAGADAVFNGIVVRDQGSWRYADFDCGTTAVACAGDPGNATRYAVNGTEVDGTFHSEPNDCDPSCAGGTHYDVAWRWNPTYGTFAVASSRVLPTLSQ